MTLSVIIPYYRDFAKLLRAVNSIPQRPDVEVIIVDNGEEHLADGCLGNVRIERSARGAGIARNRGIDLARGEWLLFLDADDWFEPNAIHRIIQMTATDADVCYFMSRAVNLANHTPSLRNEMFNGYLRHYLDTGDDTLLRYKCGIPVCKLIRTSLLRQHNIRFDEIPCCEDKMFAVKLGFHARRIEAYPDRLYVIEESTDSLSRQFPLQHLRVTMQAYIDYNRFIKNNHLNVPKDSVMSLVWRALRGYGAKAALDLALMSIRQGNNLLTGCGGWLKTLTSLKRVNRRVIVNADDLGLTPEVNNAILHCFDRMEITSTSLITNAPASDAALNLIKNNHLESRVGLHFNLCEGVPLSDDLRRCPRFVSPDGNLCYQHRMWIRLSADERLSVRKECEAQFQWMADHGLNPTHFDSHFHVHTSPSIYLSIRPVLKQYAVKRVRIGRNLQIHGALNRIYKHLYRTLLRHDGFDTTRYFSDTRFMDERLTDIEYECHPM